MATRYGTQHIHHSYGDIINEGGTAIFGSNIQAETINFGDNVRDPYLCLRELGATDSSAEMMRIEQSKDVLIEDSFAWVLRNETFNDWYSRGCTQVLRLTGGPGKGKTMTLIGITKHLKTQISRGNSTGFSYFFCQGTDARLSSALAVLKGLIFTLLSQNYACPLLSYLENIYKKGGPKVFEGPAAFYTLKELLSEVLEDKTFNEIIFLVDALDECKTNLEQLLGLIASTTASSGKIKWLISSRNYDFIEEKLRSRTGHIDISLEVHTKEVNYGISLYIHEKTAYLSRVKGYNVETKSFVEKILHTKAQGTYLWIDLICKELERTRKSTSKVMSLLEKTPPGLDAVYNLMIENIRSWNNNDDEDLQACADILSAVTVAINPLSLEDLIPVTGLNEDIASIQGLITRCGSFVSIVNRHVYLVHQSAKDYLESIFGAPNSIIRSTKGQTHKKIFENSLSYIARELKQDMMQLKYPPRDRERLIWCSQSQYLQNSKNGSLEGRPDLYYVCSYWVDHLQVAIESEPAYSPIDVIFEFLRRDYLQWIEYMSTAGKIRFSIGKMAILRAFFQAEIKLQSAISDCEQFLRENSGMLENSPLQVYCSALLFTPERNWVKNQYRSKIPSWITEMPTIQDDWEAVLQTLEIPLDKADHIDPNYEPQLVFSSCGQYLAWSHKSQVALFEVETGALLTRDTCPIYNSRPFTPKRPSTMRKEYLIFESITFSPDASHLILSGFTEERRKRALVLFFPKSRTWEIVPKLGSSRVSNWDISNANYESILHLLLSPTCDFIVILRAYVIEIYNIKARSIYRSINLPIHLTVLRRPRWRVFKKNFTDHYPALSPNGELVALAVDDSSDLEKGTVEKKIGVWNNNTGAFETQISVDCNATTFWIDFAPDSKTLMVTANSDSCIIELWDVSTWTRRLKIDLQSSILSRPHIWSTNFMSYVAFEGIQQMCYEHLSFDEDWEDVDWSWTIGSGGKSIYTWDITKGTLVDIFEMSVDFGHRVYYFQFKDLIPSPMNEHIALHSSSSQNVGIWNLRTRKQLILARHHGGVSAICKSPDKGFLAVATDNLIKIWAVDNLETEPEMLPKKYDRDFWPFTIGKNHSRALTDIFKTKKNLESQKQTIVNYHHSKIQMLSISPDGKIVASRASNGEIRFWDKALKNALVLPGVELLNRDQLWQNILSLDFSQSGRQIMSVWQPYGVRLGYNIDIWDAEGTHLKNKNIYGNRDEEGVEIDLFMATISPDGSVMAYCTERFVGVIDILQDRSTKSTVRFLSPQYFETRSNVFLRHHPSRYSRKAEHIETKFDYSVHLDRDFRARFSTNGLLVLFYKWNDRIFWLYSPGFDFGSTDGIPIALWSPGWDIKLEHNAAQRLQGEYVFDIENELLTFTIHSAGDVDLKHEPKTTFSQDRPLRVSSDVSSISVGGFEIMLPHSYRPTTYLAHGDGLIIGSQGGRVYNIEFNTKLLYEYLDSFEN